MQAFKPFCWELGIRIIKKAIHLSRDKIYNEVLIPKKTLPQIRYNPIFFGDVLKTFDIFETTKICHK